MTDNIERLKHDEQENWSDWTEESLYSADTVETLKVEEIDEHIEEEDDPYLRISAEDIAYEENPRARRRRERRERREQRRANRDDSKMAPWMVIALAVAFVALVASPINAWATFLLIPAWRNFRSALEGRDTARLNDETYRSLRGGIFWFVLAVMFMFSAFSLWPLLGGWLASKFIFNRWKERTFSPIVE